jgi:hypothetical protein
MILSVGKYGAKINTAIELLRKCKLFLKENRNPKTPSGIASLVKQKGYQEIWKLLIEGSSFRILLIDYSFFTFEIDPNGYSSNNLISMSYYGCPFKFIDLESYIVQEFGEEYIALMDEPWIMEGYQQTLCDSVSLESPVTFRYDYAPTDYDSGRHPASHLHIGHNNEIRVGCERILNPVSFIAFVIRQQYPEIWKSVVLPSHLHLCKKSIRDAIPSVPIEFKSENDRFEMHLD